MKKIFFFLFTIFSYGVVFSQTLNPVSWAFSSKKTGENSYELQIIATIQQGWHLYSQSQPSNAVAQPTSFVFNKNPLLSLEGKVKENGKMIKFKDEKLGVSANQYSDKVIFVQKIRLKGNAKTNVTGKLEYQTCNDERCLPPKTVNISIPL